jgi:drug/metabolite transporter (DMT)-like permease
MVKLNANGGRVGEEAAAKTAALVAAALWAVAITVFTFTARRLGPQMVNGARLLLAATLLVLIHGFAFGSLWPTGLGGSRTLWLLVSGFIGFTLGDGFGLESFVRIGPRLGMLVQTLAPVFSTTLAWAIFGQRLSWLRLLAVAVTLAGIALVVAPGSEAGNPAAARLRWTGLLFALLAALCQALGQLTSLQGMEGGVPALSATVVRISAGATGALALLALRGRLSDLRGAWADRRSLAQFLGGTSLGTLLGVPLSLYALAHAPLGVAATLLFMTPVFLLPLSRIFFHEPLTWRSVGGTMLTVAGAAGLFLFP